MIGASVLHSSVKQDWQTPDDVLDVVRQVGPIALDPCTVTSNPTGARHFYTPAEDGLSRSWSTDQFRDIVYVNPPYGRECAAWVAKAIEEAKRGTKIVMLVAARPGSRWCQDLLTNATIVCWWRGRIRFRGATAGAPFDSLFASFNTAWRFEAAFAGHGVLMLGGEG